MERKILEMIGITKYYYGVKALDDVNFDLNPGEVHILAGEDGAGKTTLMRILAGMEKMDSGKIKMFGRDVKITSSTIAKAKRISTVPHEFKLIDCLSIAENIFLGKEPVYNNTMLINWRILKTRARVILDILGLKRDINTLVEELDAAEKRIVEMAKTLSFDAKIITIDEPTFVLSEKEANNLFKLIRILKLKGISIIYLSHRTDEIYKVGDRVSILREGVIIDTKPVKQMRRGELIRKMTGMNGKRKLPDIKFKKGKEVLRLDNVSGAGKVKNVNLEVFEGEIFGIVGLVGSGISELGKIIFGAEKKKSGDIYLGGEKIKISSPRDAIILGIGLLTKDRNNKGLIPFMNIAENITITNLNSVIKRGLISKKKEKAVVLDFFKELNINSSAVDGNINDLSEGDKQKIMLARWLSVDSKVLIFDEPDRGMDTKSRMEIYKLIINLVKKGIAVVIISSELPEIAGICNRFAVMHKGRIAGILSKKEASQSKIMKLASG